MSKTDDRNTVAILEVFIVFSSFPRAAELDTFYRRNAPSYYYSASV